MRPSAMKRFRDRRSSGSETPLIVGDARVIDGKDFFDHDPRYILRGSKNQRARQIRLDGNQY